MHQYSVDARLASVSTSILSCLLNETSTGWIGLVQPPGMYMCVKGRGVWSILVILRGVHCLSGRTGTLSNSVDRLVKLLNSLAFVFRLLLASVGCSPHAYLFKNPVNHPAEWQKVSESPWHTGETATPSPKSFQISLYSLYSFSFLFSSPFKLHVLASFATVSDLLFTS